MRSCVPPFVHELIDLMEQPYHHTKAGENTKRQRAVKNASRSVADVLHARILDCAIVGLRRSSRAGWIGGLTASKNHVLRQRFHRPHRGNGRLAWATHSGRPAAPHPHCVSRVS